MSAPGWSNLKPDAAECPCGCGLVGRPRAKTMRDGLQHVRGCKCPRCRGSRNSKQGRRKQNAAAAQLGLATGKFSAQHEENMGGAVRVEVKSGKADTGPAWTRFLLCERQSEAARPIGDHRPFACVLMPPGEGKDGLVLVRLSDVHEFCAAVVEMRGNG